MRIGKAGTDRRYDRYRLRTFNQEAGLHWGTPKEIWGFTMEPSERPPSLAALDVLKANAVLLGLESTTLKRRYTFDTPGGWHVIFSQEHLGRYIERAYVSVHMTNDRQPFLIRNRTVPRALLPAATRQVAMDVAREAAHRAIRREPAAANVVAAEELWFPDGRHLRPAYKFRIEVRRPKAADWIVFIDASHGSLIKKYDNLSLASGPARVFDPNPVVALGRWTGLMSGNKPAVLPKSAYTNEILRDVRATGVLSGPRVRVTSDTVRRRPLNFAFASDERGFKEVMAYHHLDTAIRYVETLGYSGRRAIFRGRFHPLRVDARARGKGSFFNSATKQIELGRVKGIDDAEDAETILHEFGHAVQDAICPFFGQSAEAAAMGEGFGDYFAASFFLSRKRRGLRRRLIPTVMSWNAIGLNQFTRARPPAMRRLDSRQTFRAFAEKNGEHRNGTIWSATLWDVLQKVGRDVADRIIIESHFQLDNHTTFARGARAILDADVNLFRGRHIRTLKQIFRRRAIGPLE